MKKIILLIMFVSTISLTASGQTLNRCDYKDNKKDKRIEEEFKRLHAYEADIILRGDVAALDSFYPEDHIVTNPFNQMIDKKTVLERVRGNIIKYKSYEKKMEYLCVYKDTAIIAGIEIGAPADDANRPDAGQTSKRRFTETWIKRGKKWVKVARHVSTITAQ
jgi:hypothetical protein